MSGINGGDKAPAVPLSPPNETSSARKGSYLIEVWGKGSSGKPQTAQDITKAIGVSPQPDIKAL